MEGINRGREHGIDMLRGPCGEKFHRILEEYIGLVTIHREVLSTGESMRINKIGTAIRFSSLLQRGP